MSLSSTKQSGTKIEMNLVLWVIGVYLIVIEMYAHKIYTMNPQKNEKYEVKGLEYFLGIE